MKHCLNCYKMIQNNADVCHFCGADQKEIRGVNTSPMRRCPRCMSFLYNEVSGCQYCGYKPAPKKNPVFNIVLFSIIGFVLVLLVLWKLGVFDSLGITDRWNHLFPSPTETEQVPSAASTADVREGSDQFIINRRSDTATQGETLQILDEENDWAENHPTVEPADLTANRFTCNDQVSQFSPEMLGRLRFGKLSNYLRQKPDTASPAVSTITRETIFRVREEQPVCAEDYLWIPVILVANGKTGWTVEGNGEEYWLEPIAGN